jgi:hypothetical protein
MLNKKSKKIALPLCLCVISALLSPTLTHADTAIVLAASGTGEIAAIRAAEQKAALAKKAAERQKATEALKNGEPQKNNVETQKNDAEAPKEKTPAN